MVNFAWFCKILSNVFAEKSQFSQELSSKKRYNQEKIIVVIAFKENSEKPYIRTDHQVYQVPQK